MRVFFYRYNSICEPDIIATFEEFGFEVDICTLELDRKDIYPAQQVKKVGQYLQEHPADFVFSINFFPMLSEVCNIFHIRYISWVVDSPVMELFSRSICNEWNRTFLFDREIYREISGYNPGRIFHLPLAARVEEKEKLFAGASRAEQRKFAHDVR